MKARMTIWLYTAALLLCTSSALPTGEYRVRFLETPAGLEFPAARAINAVGQTVGEAREKGFWEYGVVWNVRGSVTAIIRVTGSDYTRPVSINNLGQAAGYSFRRGGAYQHGFVWDPFTGVADRWAVSETKWSRVWAMNDDGVAAGDGTSPVTGQVVPVRWDGRGGWTLLPGLGDPYGIGGASDINNRGQIVGFAVDRIGREWPCIWEPDGTVRKLPILPGFAWGRAEHVSERGQVVGMCDGSYRQSTLWDAEGRAVPISITGSKWVGAADLNDAGQVVGNWTDTNNRGHGFIWSFEAGPIELTAQGVRGFSPQALNNRGVIAGFGVESASNTSRACLLVPVVRVVVDIKPLDAANRINPASRGVVPVAVITTNEFDAGTIDPETVKMAGAKAARWRLEDIDCDGRADLLLHFRTQELELAEDTTQLTLEAVTYDWQTCIEGSDQISLVGRKN